MSLIVPWQNVENKPNNVFIDFSDCQFIYSSYLVLLLIRIIKILSNNTHKREWHSHHKLINETYGNIIYLNFFHILDIYGTNSNLFWNKEFSNEYKNKIIHTSSCNNIIHSFPLYFIEINNCINRRDILSNARKHIINMLTPYYDEFKFNLSQLTLIINEILKNTADHTKSNAFFGLDVEFIDNEIIIRFGIGDLGIGINMSIKNHLPEDMINRYAFWDLTQTYRYALSKGGTTKIDSIDNKGMGMSIIINAAKELGMDLSIFDADSRGLLTNIKSLTHSDIRKNFYNTGKQVGFYYYGTLKAKRI